MMWMSYWMMMPTLPRSPTPSTRTEVPIGPLWGRRMLTFLRRTFTHTWRSGTTLFVPDLCLPCICQRSPRSVLHSYMLSWRGKRLMSAGWFSKILAMPSARNLGAFIILLCWLSSLLHMALILKALKYSSEKGHLTKNASSAYWSMSWGRRSREQVLLVHRPLAQHELLRPEPPLPTLPAPWGLASWHEELDGSQGQVWPQHGRGYVCPIGRFSAEQWRWPRVDALGADLPGEPNSYLGTRGATIWGWGGGWRGNGDGGCRFLSLGGLTMSITSILSICLLLF